MTVHFDQDLSSVLLYFLRSVIIQVDKVIKLIIIRLISFMQLNLFRNYLNTIIIL